MLVFFIIELISLIFLAKSNKDDNKNYVFEYDIFKDVDIISKLNKNIDIKLLSKLGYVILYLVLFIILASPAGLAGLGEIFLSGDSVVSWNRWAVELATIGDPLNPNRYPQLVPSILSIPYVFMNDTWIQFFSYAIMLIFPSCLILTCISIYKKFPISSFIIVIIFYLWPIKQFVHYIGYADFPVATLSFMAISALIWGYKEDEIVRKKCLIISAFFLGAACATKQSGLVLLLFYPFLIFEFKILNFTNKKYMILSLLIIILFIAAPWNIYSEYLIKSNLSESNLNWLIEGIHRNRTYIERIIYAFKKYPTIIIFAIFAIPGLFIPFNRSISAFSLFYFIIWILFFSYDERNIYIIIPSLSFSIGLTLQYFKIRDNALTFLNFNFIYKIKFKPKKYLLIIIAIFLIVIIIKSDDINYFLNKRQDSKSLMIGNHKSDSIFIVNLLKTDDKIILISTDPGVQYLTKDIKNRILSYHTERDLDYSTKLLDKIINNYSDKIIYIYLDKRVNTEIVEVIKNKATLVFSGNGFLYKLNNYNIIQ
jgi:hypothetical protein